MTNIDEIQQLMDHIEYAKDDRLTQFTLRGSIDRMEELRQANLKLLFKTAKKYKVQFLYIGSGEIAGCEDVRYRGWPAMWRIAESVGYPESCGNTDQYQCHGSGIAYPSGSYGAWDIISEVKLSDEESDKKNFNRVTTRRR